MKLRTVRLMAVAMMLVGMAVLVAPSVGQAITITAIDVSITNTTTATTTHFTGPGVWTVPIVLGNAGTALLSQTVGYNFDGSDLCFSPQVCGAPTITVTTDKGIFVYTDATKKLTAAPVVDTLANPPLETQEFVQATGGSPLLALFVGYADDAHLEAPHTACAATVGSNDGVPAGTLTNCRPDPFTANIVQANSFAGGPTACLGSVTSCFDAGVLRFVANDTPAKVPEPATLLLLGAGIVGLAAWGRKRMQS